MRGEISSVQDGEYFGHESYDNDCFKPVNVDIKVKITIRKDTLKVDFTGTSKQIKGFKNSSLANTHSAVYTAVASFFDHSIPRNEGTFRCIEIIAPLGTVVNAKFPAPVTMCTVFPASEIIHSCWWALGNAVPERNCAGWGKNSFPNASGKRSDGTTWVMYNWGGLSGAGAVNGRDGFNQIGPLVTLGGLTIPNAESYERLYPVVVYKQEFRKDAAGVGKFRGGSGICYEAYYEVPVEYSFRADGLARDTGLGVQGGGDGKKGIVTLYPNADKINKLTPPDYGLLQVEQGEIHIISPAGGGFGDPLERDVESVLRDVRDEIISLDAARNLYGVIFKKDNSSLDIEATEKLRNSKINNLYS
jgi:N-methylhydantoinase B